MDRLLVVEDSAFFRNLIVNELGEESGLEVVAVGDFAAAKDLIDQENDDYFLALLDMNLPDCKTGAVVDYALERDVPSVVFTAEFDNGIRESYLSAGVLDFILKDSPSSLRYLTGLTRRIRRNRDVHALVVDDSPTVRRMTSELLERYQLRVSQASDGAEALKVMEAAGDITLVLTDYEMPGMDGFELINRIRRKWDRDKVSVIGVSGSGGAPLSAKFIKYGANDFIHKPYLPEELYVRVSQNLDLLDDVRTLTEMATKDFLTGLYNRRTFFDMGSRLIGGAKRKNESFAVAMTDIDHFKSINDTYGHDIGDEVLKQVSAILSDHAGRTGDLVARLGGEEFSIVIRDTDRDKAFAFFDALRARIAAEPLPSSAGPIPVTMSVGVSGGRDASLEDALTTADQKLYAAKHGGRNNVQIDWA